MVVHAFLLAIVIMWLFLQFCLPLWLCGDSCYCACYNDYEVILAIVVAAMIICHISYDAEHKVPPSFDIPLKPVTINEDNKLTLSCHVRGSPPLKVQWMKDRRELSSSASTKITFVDGTATFEVLRVSKNDAGDYLCKATNEAGSEFCKSRVTVKGIQLLRKLLDSL